MVIPFMLLPVGMLISCCMFSPLASYLYNNQQLQRFADNLYTYPLPPRTQVVSKHAEVTLLGNGNHCDFVAEQLLQTELT